MNQTNTWGKLIPPYGGKLVNLLVTGEEREALLAEANRFPSLQISDRNLNSHPGNAEGLLM